MELRKSGKQILTNLAANLEAGHIEARLGNVAVRVLTKHVSNLNPKLMGERWRGLLEFQNIDI